MTILKKIIIIIILLINQIIFIDLNIEKILSKNTIKIEKIFF